MGNNNIWIWLIKMCWCGKNSDLCRKWLAALFFPLFLSAGTWKAPYSLRNLISNENFLRESTQILISSSYECGAFDWNPLHFSDAWCQTHKIGTFSNTWNCQFLVCVIFYQNAFFSLSLSILRHPSLWPRLNFTGLVGRRETSCRLLEIQAIPTCRAINHDDFLL